MNEIRIGDCLQIMKALIDDGVKVQTCVTSPPYFGLRDYGIDGQLGLEKTPTDYVARLVEVFRLVHDLLAGDGTLWLNLGDSYAGSWGAQSHDGLEKSLSARQILAHPKGTLTGSLKNTPGLKPKDLIGIPWRVAFALQADGWYLRSDIIWAKPNPMPESVKDRPTKSHEYIFLLSKSEDYFFNAHAVKQQATSREETRDRSTDTCNVRLPNGSDRFSPGPRTYTADGLRNIRSVWNVPTQPYAGAHFATFPPDLILPCVLAGSRPGDIVFDPFMGSGTTALVAKENGRRYLGCELNPDYRALQDARLSQAVLFGWCAAGAAEAETKEAV